MAHFPRRARFQAQLQERYTPRKVLLALDSGVPEEISWALNGLILASCPPENQNPSTPADRLSELVSLVRIPHMLRVLLPIATRPHEAAAANKKRKSSALFPTPPAAATTRELALTNWRQAWVLLRNMSLMPENEGTLAQSAALRRLLLHTLRSAFRDHDAELPVTPAELAELFAAAKDDAAAGRSTITAELQLSSLTMPPVTDVQGQCQLNPYCVRGFRHCGRGGPCRLIHPTAPPSAPPPPPPPPQPARAPATLASPMVGGAEGSPTRRAAALPLVIDAERSATSGGTRGATDADAAPNGSGGATARQLAVSPPPLPAAVGALVSLRWRRTPRRRRAPRPRRPAVAP